jgi:predicted nucleic acid-binding protein
MRILIDTNVILDVLLDREPHVQASAAVWTALEKGSSRGMLAAHAVTTIHYLIRKQAGNTKATRAMASILSVFKVAAVDGAVIQGHFS